MKIRDLLFTLSALDGVGSITEANDKVYEILSQYATVNKESNGSIIGFMDGKSDYTLMLDAHIDQVAFIVTDIDENGFLTVSNSGGIDIRALPSRTVTVHGKEKISAVFCATPPHLANGDIEYDDISKIKLDTALGLKAKDIISIGDYVTFKGKSFSLSDTRVCSHSFDNRAGTVCLLELAKRLKDKELPFNVAFCFSTGEELGLRGVRTASFKINPQEAIAVDVTFGDFPDISETESSKLSNGAIIGISPTLDKNISQKLMETAKEKNIPYDLEIMAESTGTNADMISVSRIGVKTSTVSIPLRNMHTATEILDLKDLIAVCDLLENYIVSGGCF